MVHACTQILLLACRLNEYSANEWYYAAANERAVKRLNRRCWFAAFAFTLAEYSFFDTTALLAVAGGGYGASAIFTKRGTCCPSAFVAVEKKTAFGLANIRGPSFG